MVSLGLCPTIWVIFLTQCCLSYTQDNELPETFNWAEKGVVTPVKSQGKCSNGWAFATVGVVEGAHALKTGKLLNMSEQQLTDCIRDGEKGGCNGGGNVKTALNFVMDNKGLDTASCYPYRSTEGACTRNYHYICRGGEISVMGFVQKNNEKALKETLYRMGPMAVMIHASDKFKEYKGGVFMGEDCSLDSVNHGVLLIGYGTEGGQDYWLIKNSYGSTWGEAGFGKIARNKGNVCGIATAAVFGIA